MAEEDLLSRLAALGFSAAKDKTVPDDVRQNYLIREFQTYAACPSVAHVRDAKARIYSDGLESVANTKKFTRNPDGVADKETLDLIAHWEKENWRCPVVIEAWWTERSTRPDPARPNGSLSWRKRVAIVDDPRAQNLWMHRDVEGLKPKKERPPNTLKSVYARDFSGRLKGNPLFDALTTFDERILLGRHFTSKLKNAPGSGPVSITGERLTRVTPNALTGEPYDKLDTPTKVLFRVIDSVASVECSAFFDSITAWDRAVMSVGLYHWTLSRFTTDGKTFERGELEAFLAYLMKEYPDTFAQVIGGFGVEPVDDWYARDANEAPSIAHPEFRNYQSTFEWVAVDPDDSEKRIVEEIPHKVEILNLFRSWHWFYRFQVAARVLPGFHKAAWDYARFRVRDVLAIEIPKDAVAIPPNKNATKVVLGDVFRSECTVTLLLQAHVLRTSLIVSDIARGRPSDRVINAIKNAGKNGVPLDKPTNDWPRDCETHLLGALRDQLKTFAGGLAVTRQRDATRNPELRIHKRPAIGGSQKKFANLSLLLGSFPTMTFDTLYPPPKWE